MLESNLSAIWGFAGGVVSCGHCPFLHLARIDLVRTKHHSVNVKQFFT